VSLQEKLSVFMPVRDSAVHVEDAIGSVLASTLEAFELVVADHGSLDATPTIISEIAAKDERIKIINFDRQVPFPQVLEEGRQFCRTPLMARMDSDDRMHCERLQDDLQMFETYPQAAVVSSQVELFPPSQVQEGMALYMQWQNEILTPAQHDKEIWIEQTICQPAATMRQAALNDIGGYREGPFPEDYDLFMRLHVAGATFYKRSKVGHYWRRHQESISVVSDDYHQDAFARVKAMGLKEKFNLAHKPVCVLGSGRHGGRIARLLMAQGVTIDAFFDVSPKRIGSTRHGVPILAQESLAGWKSRNTEGFAIGAVGVRGKRALVRELLEEAQFSEPQDAICIA
jgi:glycosyltransferase involved in cell wall biosynthesis